MTHFRLTACGVFIIGCVLAIGCSSKSEGGVQPVANDSGVLAADASPTAGGWAGSACGSCIASECTSVRATCDLEPSCAAHASCVDKCAPDATGLPDAACVAACPKADGEAATRRRVAYDTCVAHSAAATCTACGGRPDAGIAAPDVLTQKCGASTEVNACFKCEDEKCCDTFAACVAVDDCKLVLQPCLKNCGSDKDCQKQCYDKTPNGVPTWARRQACIRANCSESCSGTLDACVRCAWQGACRNEFARCYADAPCFLASECLTRCPNGNFSEQCLAGCEVGLPEASRILLESSLACAGTSCAAECE